MSRRVSFRLNAALQQTSYVDRDGDSGSERGSWPWLPATDSRAWLDSPDFADYSESSDRADLPCR